MVFYPELTRSTIWVRICSRVAHLVLQKALLSKQYYSIRIKRLRSRGLSGATVFDPLAGALLSNSRYNAGFSLGSTISKSIVDRVYGATEFAGTPTMRKNLVFMRGDYFREYVLSRRVSDQLSAGMRKWSVAKSDLF
jgi:hypothetical protein